MIMPSEPGGLRKQARLPWETIDPTEKLDPQALSAHDVVEEAPEPAPAPEPVQIELKPDPRDAQPLAASHAPALAHASAASATTTTSTTTSAPIAIESDAGVTVLLERDETGHVILPEPEAQADEETEAEADEATEEDRKLAYAQPAALPATAGGGWTVAALCIGLAVIAACVIIPQADANRRLVYEREKLHLDLEQIRKQVTVNKQFLQRVESDPQLAERLAQRQMKMIPEGSATLDVKANDHRPDDATAAAQEMSPFLIVNVPPPPPLAPYQPIGGTFATLCREPRSQLYLMGGGMFLVAAGLVLGYAPKPDAAENREENV